MSIDIDYHNRLDWLAELMLQNPKSRVRRLQREALKYYSLSSKEAIRNWMSWRTAFAAADVANRKAGLETTSKNRSIYYANHTSALRSTGSC
jgi:hypothetical protein